MSKTSFDELVGKVVVLTGGGGVIGASIAEILVKNGAKVAILDIKKEFADKVADALNEKYGKNSAGFEANVLQKESLLKAKEAVHAEFGSVDILINGAGGNSPLATTKQEFVSPDNLEHLEETFFGLSEDGFKKVFDLNFLGTVLPTMVFAEEMVKRGGGVILNISSMNAFRPLTKIPAYSAAKASINNFTEWLAVHFAKTNVRVNGIAPGFFVTNQNRFLMFDEKTGELSARGQKIINGTPMNRFGDIEDLQGTILYLLSDLSKFVTGVTIPVDGGFNAYSGV